jgi:hypothetical protein
MTNPEKLTLVIDHREYHPQEVGHADVNNTGQGSVVTVVPKDVELSGNSGGEEKKDEDPA